MMAMISRGLYKVMMVGHGFSDIYWFILTLCLPLISQEFKLSYTQSGFLLTAVLIISSIGSLLTGYLGDRIGKGIIIGSGTLLGSIGLILAAGSSDYKTLLLLLGLSSLGASAFHPSMIAFIVDHVTSGLGKVLGYFEFFGFSGAVVVLLIMSPLLDHYLRWQQIFYIIALPGFVFFFIFCKKLGAFERMMKGEEQEMIGEEKPLNHHHLYFFIGAITIRSMGFFAIFSFLPTFFVTITGVGMGLAGYLFLVTQLGAMVGSLFMGYLTDRFKALFLMQVLTFASLPFIFLLTMSRGIVLFPLLLLLGIFHAGIFPPQLFYLSHFSRRTHSGSLYGMMIFISTIIGAFSPGVLGFLADGIGLVQAYQLTIIVIFLAGILLTLLKKMEEMKKHQVANIMG